MPGAITNPNQCVPPTTQGIAAIATGKGEGTTFTDLPVDAPFHHLVISPNEPAQLGLDNNTVELDFNCKVAVSPSTIPITTVTLCLSNTAHFISDLETLGAETADAHVDATKAFADLARVGGANGLWHTGAPPFVPAPAGADGGDIAGLVGLPDNFPPKDSVSGELSNSDLDRSIAGVVDVVSGSPSGQSDTNRPAGGLQAILTDRRASGLLSRYLQANTKLTYLIQRITGIRLLV